MGPLYFIITICISVVIGSIIVLLLESPNIKYTINKSSFKGKLKQDDEDND